MSDHGDSPGDGGSDGGSGRPGGAGDPELSRRKSNGGGPGGGRVPRQRPGIIRPPGVWVLTVGRLVVLYVAATFFGANVALAVDAWEAGESAIGPIIGAIAMSLLSLYVLTRSYRHRPASGKGPGSESPDRG